jgi:ABC-2 type transport system permease protein
MFSIFKKEVNLFLSSLVGYIAVAIFLLGTGLFLWVFNDYSVIEYGYSDLSVFFRMAPYVFLFLIPAITMRTLAEEQQTGTLELLITRPLSNWQIILGKYLACLFLVALAILPTLIYYLSVYELGFPKGNLDKGASWGAYLGLFFLGSAFCSIGLFTSALTKNQIVAFLLAFFTCAFFFEAFSSIARFDLFFGKTDTIIEAIGINYHYDSLSKGLISSRDLIYFASFSGFFLYLSKVVMERNQQ